MRQRSGIKGRREPYTYHGQTTLVANSAGQISFQIASNYTFVLLKFTYRSQCNNANTIPTFDFQLLKNEKGIFLDYVPNDIYPGRMVEISTAPDTVYQVGFADWHKFDIGYPFEAKSNMIINLRDTCGQANTVRMILEGYKIYDTY